MTCDKAAFREALGRFATGVCIMTIKAEKGAALGVTVNSFCSVSLDPPLVLFCLKRTAESFEKFSTSEYWGVNILTEAQKSLSERGTRKGGEILSSDEFELKTFGAPILNESLASLICRRENAVIVGDHSVIVGRVMEINYSPDKKPLVHYHKAYRRLG